MKIARLFLLMLLVVAVSAMAVQPGGGNLGARPGADSLGGSNTTACDWYWIECNNGTSDSCCADLGTCWDYCESICGGPCIYIPSEQ